MEADRVEAMAVAAAAEAEDAAVVSLDPRRWWSASRVEFCKQYANLRNSEIFRKKLLSWEMH